jgi:hypothetical protein
MKRLALTGFALLTLSACAHHRSVLPDVKEVKVGREAAGDDCKELGPINGTTSSAKGTREQALEDLKREAANKGANYVMIKQYSAYGTSVVGVGYECP